MHLACEKGLVKLAETLLEKGSNPNAKTHMPAMSGFEDTENTKVYRQTPLHVAIANRHAEIVAIFLQYKGNLVLVYLSIACAVLSHC